jgi:hypothetical protein
MNKNLRKRINMSKDVKDVSYKATVCVRYYWSGSSLRRGHFILLPGHKLMLSRSKHGFMEQWVNRRQEDILYPTRAAAVKANNEKAKALYGWLDGKLVTAFKKVFEGGISYTDEAGDSCHWQVRELGKKGKLFTTKNAAIRQGLKELQAESKEADKLKVRIASLKKLLK